MGQLLMSRQTKFGLGFCPVAGVDFDRMRPLFKLEETHVFIHCLLGGPAGGIQQAGGAASETGPVSLTAHFSGPPPDRTGLAAVAAARLDALNAMSDAEHEQLHRLMLHLRQPGTADREVKLHPVAYVQNEFLLRATQRSYLHQPVSFSSFSRFLALLRQERRSGAAKRLYPSAGGRYGVQTFVHIKAAAVENIAPGIYAYNPLAHCLHRVGAADGVDVRRAHFPGNRSYFNQAAFSLFLIARLGGLQPVFGSESLYLAMLEAGYIGQLLMDRQAEFGMGVCPIGAMRFDAIAPAFQLSPDCRLVHSFLCGPVQRTVSMTGHECLKTEG
jgi:polyketide synthase PksN